jgi:hypothetical protein
LVRIAWFDFVELAGGKMRVVVVHTLLVEVVEVVVHALLVEVVVYTLLEVVAEFDKKMLVAVCNQSAAADMDPVVALSEFRMKNSNTDVA